MTKKRFSIIKLISVFVFLTALLLVFLSGCTGCRRDKPVGTDPAEDTARQSASPVPAEITPEPAEQTTPAPGTVTEPEITDGAIYLPPIPVDDPDDEFEPMPELTGEPESTQEPEPTESEPTLAHDGNETPPYPIG